MKFTKSQTESTLRIYSKFAESALREKNILVFNYYLDRMQVLNKELDKHERLESLQDKALLDCFRNDNIHVSLIDISNEKDKSREDISFNP